MCGVVVLLTWGGGEVAGSKLVWPFFVFIYLLTDSPSNSNTNTNFTLYFNFNNLGIAIIKYIALL